MILNGPYYGRRKPAVGKAFYVRELRGQLIVCKWPRRRRRPRHETTREQNEKFKQANWLAKYAPAAIQMAHAEMVKGTSLLPRDLMIAAMYGRGLTWQIENQRRRYPIAAITDLSDTLDILGALAGDILARGPDRWQASTPTQPGQVLTSQAAGQAPTWQTIAPGAGVWTQIEDVTLTADLAVGAVHNTVIPTGWKEIEQLAIVPFNAGGYKIRVRCDSDFGANYRCNTVASNSTGGRVSQAATAFSSFITYPSGLGNLAGQMTLNTKVTRNLANERVMITGMGFEAGNNTLLWTGQWQNVPAVEMTQLGLVSTAGVGLRIGTRIIVRAVLPAP